MGLNNQLECPAVGIGTFMLSPTEAENSVREALKMGYSLVDTANAYVSFTMWKERMNCMGKSLVAVNAGSRVKWNTDTLINEAIKGAESQGATVQKFDLFRLEKYTGCISCFGCKKEKYKGHCICRDGLTPVLDAIRESDGLIIGSPNYLGELTASFRALYERLIFQNLTYNLETPCCNEHPVPVLLMMTSNAPDTMYLDMMQNYQRTLSRFVGPTEMFISGDTLQLKDYNKTDWQWTMFNPEAKQKRHDEVFPQECQKAFEQNTRILEIKYS